ncbi:MAG: sulfotransferase domain-containing protein [Phormidesmis sp.]
MLQRLLFSASEPTYHLFDRARRRLRPLYESDIQKHKRERQTADYLLLSLTNCGRTWLRVILGRALQLHYAHISGIEAVNLHDLFSFSERIPTLPAIKPMHEKYGQFGNRYEQQKVILLVRDPRDALVSRYHQHKDELGFDSLDRYVCESSDLHAYIQFYNDWQTHRDSAKDLLLVRYEDMKENTFHEVQRVGNFLELPLTPTEIHQAIDYASFQNMRKMEVEGTSQVRTKVMSARDISNPESFKVRKGTIGGYRAELAPEAIAFVDSTVSAQLNPIYGYSSVHADEDTPQN